MKTQTQINNKPILSKPQYYVLTGVIIFTIWRLIKK